MEATTFRKVQRDSGVGGDSERVKLRLQIVVEQVEYDAEGGCCTVDRQWAHV